MYFSKCTCTCTNVLLTVCVCVKEKERESQREREKESHRERERGTELPLLLYFDLSFFAQFEFPQLHLEDQTGVARDTTLYTLIR